MVIAMQFINVIPIFFILKESLNQFSPILLQMSVSETEIFLKIGHSLEQFDVLGYVIWDLRNCWEFLLLSWKLACNFPVWISQAF